jgi:hypothetical protein
MTSNQIIAYSELVAFFLVTLDLYGKERLLKLQGQLQALFSPDHQNRHPIAGIFALLFAVLFVFWSIVPIGLVILFDYYVYSKFNLVVITIVFLLSSIVILLLILLTPVVHFWGAVFADQIMNRIIAVLFNFIIGVMRESYGRRGRPDC